MDKNGTTQHLAGNDVYYKGAHVLHSLRYLIGDDVFKSSLREYVTMPKELEKNQTSTEEFISLINENTGSDLQWFFDVYLYQSDLPILNIKEKHENNRLFVDFWWENEGFKIPIEISYNSYDNEVKRKIELNNVPFRIALSEKFDYKVDPNSWLLYKTNQTHN